MGKDELVDRYGCFIFFPLLALMGAGPLILAAQVVAFLLTGEWPTWLVGDLLGPMRGPLPGITVMFDWWREQALWIGIWFPAMAGAYAAIHWLDAK